MPLARSLALAVYAALAATSLSPSVSIAQSPRAEPVQFNRGDSQSPLDLLRPNDDNRRYDDRNRDQRYDDRYPRDDRGRDDRMREDRMREDRMHEDRMRDERGRDDRARDDRRREDDRGGRGSQQALAQQIQDAQTRHNQGVVALQQQFNQRQINRPQMDAGIRQLEGQMNAEIARAQEAQRR